MRGKSQPSLPWHLSRSSRGQERILELMPKSIDVIADVIRNTKHPFKQVADRPDKPHKHRYERRKIKQYIQLGDWIQTVIP